MKPVKLFTLLIALLLFLTLASQSYADISNAAVLYLRIAPGARAAAMGEAYVALVDDATSTHWNPAGLGSYPLSNSWQETTVPDDLRPISAMASLRTNNGSNYLAYDIWAITPKGLARYDNKNWNLTETFNTKTNQTVEKIVTSYFNLSDDEKRAKVVEKVVAVNNRKPLSYLEELKEKVLAVVPEGYTGQESLQNYFDSLIAAYNPCLVNWDKVEKIEKFYTDGMKDSSLTEKEIDRINFAVEKAKNRFIPEELIINYSSLFDTEPTTIVSTEEYLMIGSESGLFSFNGRRWQTFTVENGLPSENILTLTAVNNSVLIGTDKGLVRYDGLVLKAVGPEGALPEGQITAIGASSLLDIWVVINDQLYHYDGENWTGSRNYTVILDDTPEKIAEKFAVYGTSGEKEKFISLMYQINKQAAETAALPVTDEINIDSTVAIESVEASEIEDSSSTPVEGNDIISPSTIVEPTTEIVDDSLLETDEIIPDSTTGSIDETEELANEAVAEEITDEVTTEAAAEDYKLNMNPGDVIKVPYLAEFKGDVTTIHSGLNGKLWIGTSYGVVYFDGEKWVLPGYYDYTVEENQTLDELLLVNAEDNPLDSIDYCAIVNDINDINQGQLSTGQTIKLYRNPTAAPVNNIVSQRDRIYFATEKGLIEYDGVEWGHVDLKGLDKANVINVEVSGNELWFTSDRKIIIKANGKTDISMMYVKWLPELADDLYYAFFSVVSSKEGWGTFGGNMTFISYGTITRTGEGSPEAIGTFESFDLAFTGSYGTALTSKLSGGISAKFLYSKLADVGAGLEQGKGTSSGFAVDFGLLYRWNRRLTLGLSITNLGPKMAYIDAAQADPLPRNLALGFAYKLLQKDYYHFLIIGDINKSLVGINDGISEELKQVVFNGGAEFLYANILALRAGYIYDQEGDIKTVTLGVGLAPLTKIKFDFSYIPSNSNVILGNTLRISLSILP